MPYNPVGKGLDSRLCCPMLRVAVFLISSFLACKTTDSSGNDDTALGDECPQLDCRDRLTLVVLDPDGSPADSYSGTVSTPQLDAVEFSCPSEADSFPGGYCDDGGEVATYIYGLTVEVSVSAGIDAPSFTGEITPVWTAPYDSPDCGHYCYMAEETIQLEPCDGCG